MYILCICICMYMYELSGKKKKRQPWLSLENWDQKQRKRHCAPFVSFNFVPCECFIYSKSYMNTLEDYPDSLITGQGTNSFTGSQYVKNSDCTLHFS